MPCTSPHPDCASNPPGPRCACKRPPSSAFLALAATDPRIALQLEMEPDPWMDEPLTEEERASIERALEWSGSMGKGATAASSDVRDAKHPLEVAEGS